MGEIVSLQEGNRAKAASGFKRTLVVREFAPEDNSDVQRIFYHGVMEMVPDTAFRALKHHPESLLLYAAMIFACYAVTLSWWTMALGPLAVLLLRFYYSRRVALGYLKKAKLEDMGDIKGFYMNSTDSCMWVAELDGRVVGAVAADGHGKERDRVELRRMCVDCDFRQHGIGTALGRKLLEFAANRGFLSVFLGTTAYTTAAHRLYQRLGFQCVGLTENRHKPDAIPSLLERVFYRVHHYHYRLDLPQKPTATLREN